MSNRETWYVLEDGACVDPSEVGTGDDGVLRHSSGAAVAMRGDVPSSRGVDPDEERAKAKPAKAPAKEIKPEESKRGYKTREAKAD